MFCLNQFITFVFSLASSILSSSLLISSINVELINLAICLVPEAKKHKF